MMDDKASKVYEHRGQRDGMCTVEVEMVRFQTTKIGEEIRKGRILGGSLETLVVHLHWADHRPE